MVSGLSLLSWFAQNFQSSKPFLLMIGVVAIILVVVAIYLINRRVFKCLDKLEEL